jgi:hypothetical protein
MIVYLVKMSIISIINFEYNYICSSETVAYDAIYKTITLFSFKKIAG